MPTYRRLHLPGTSYFFTVNLADRRASLLTDRIADLRRAYAETVASAPVICDAMVVLPDHLHAIWTLRDARDYRMHVRYCWGNPVKHGLVARAAEWPFSSIHRDIRAGRVDAGWAGELPEGMFGE